MEITIEASSRGEEPSIEEVLKLTRELCEKLGVTLTDFRVRPLSHTA